ncbi:glycosyltransferase [Acinetobacter johnsonii]|uniref:Glycosyltransferase n=1 Tax=Acinetobacter johnsonii TaxID=40214 RepID=A0A427UM72_ACIJO|nr:glycosyltransferase [Acinetobacter johnsonii]RSE21609.1 glycosyltransferase [Acinetobacter johnsonii]
MKILYVITGLGGGGAEKVVVDLATRMQDIGHQVKIAYLKGEIVVKPKNQDIELVYLELESFSQIYKACRLYQKIINNFKPDVVHSHMIHANIFSRINQIFIKVPKLICTAHNANEGGKIRMLGYRLTNRLADINTNVSVEAVESFVNKKAFSRDALAVYNGIDLEQFYFFNKKTKNEVVRMIAIGRLTPQKDYPNLIKALAIVKETFKNFKLQIVGDGEEKDNIIDLIHHYNLQDHISLLGRRDDIAELLDQSDLFILASAYEGFGLVVAEAMATNTFVVATDCGGVKEVMGGCGILVAPEDSNILAKGILKALNLSSNEIDYNNLKAYEHVRNSFDLNFIVKKWLELYGK